MEILQAIILGIVEGITEFLPISSTAHLIVTERLINFKDSAELFTVIIQFGAILAAAWYFRKDLLVILSGLFKKDKLMLRFAKNIILALIPSIVVGLVVEKTVGIPNSLLLIGCTLIIGGVAFLVVERYPNRATDSKSIEYESLNLSRSWQIGLGQTLALIPGVSRSGATIIFGMLSGLNRKTATIFSFYLSMPIMLGASSLKLLDDGHLVSAMPGGWITIFTGTVTSFLVALIVIKWLLTYVQEHSFKPFGYYRICIGVVIILLTSFGFI